LPDALQAEPQEDAPASDPAPRAAAHDAEWRVHFHVPLHAPPTPLFGNTAADLEAVLEAVRADPTLCAHLEIETYTWEVLPPELKAGNVADQLAAEFDWVLARLGAGAASR
jgi:hypothetical protein